MALSLSGYSVCGSVLSSLSQKECSAHCMQAYIPRGISLCSKKVRYFFNFLLTLNDFVVKIGCFVNRTKEGVRVKALKETIFEDFSWVEGGSSQHIRSSIGQACGICRSFAKRFSSRRKKILKLAIFSSKTLESADIALGWVRSTGFELFFILAIYIFTSCSRKNCWMLLGGDSGGTIHIELSKASRFPSTDFTIHLSPDPGTFLTTHPFLTGVHRTIKIGVIK